MTKRTKGQKYKQNLQNTTQKTKRSSIQ